METRLRSYRLVFLNLVWFFFLAVLVGRLFVLMAFPSVRGVHPVRSASLTRFHMDAEHFRLVMTDDARGQILFRDGTPWSRPSILHGAKVVQAPPSIAPELLGTIGEPDVWPSTTRSIPEQGRSGLEWSLDPILAGKRAEYTAVMVGPDGKSIPSSQQAVTSVPALRGEDVTTTVDARQEARAEMLLRRTGISHGSIVSIALPNREFSVIASADHAHSDALHAIAPGSIFKLITLAAALDSHSYASNDSFFCDGRVHAPQVRMNCWRVHGTISIIDALAQSCDSTFAQIGMQLGRKALLTEADRFRLNRTGIAPFHGRAMLPSANSAVLYRHAGGDNGLMANTAIGQEDVRMTPVQGADLAATIAMHGVYEDTTLVRGTKAQTEERLSASRVRQAAQACQPYTAMVLQKGMWDAVHDRLGTALALHSFPIAAKTGTAELLNGRVNAWLVGYRFAGGRPTEAFALCVENEPSNKAHEHLFSLAENWLREQ
ncbi:penicillin-binding transpeptidase domain-containing protein [Alicyclobacillus dauci]|uniref:Penicillin-binding transpeptidase domain-containing protein n=1 Tax=Alicyclobacillus dauci TaxID=1475485 RepID=A0ABY6Z8W7_9BACL|nr:penicillin-binding transpeptidase domain-containing protein [Alicyclobacillus dauci]WAH38510.1 penicillin-binding transpeptidase domain-containing protein [Alicyclobacillus dauci]